MTLHFSDIATDDDIKVAAKTRLDAARTSTQHIPFSFYRDAFKPGLDAFLVVLSSIFVVPLIFLMALCIMTDGHSPFYSQKRIGRNGRVFRMWKLRTMVIDADACLAKYLAENPAALREWSETQKLKNDPRVTRVGRILRKTSLDELPQLWNVLWGQMSLVGPRPMMVCQRPLYPGSSYFRLRPGITGLWQISKRNESTFADRVVFDDTYEQSVSFVTDLQILVRTIGVVVRGTGY